MVKRLAVSLLFLYGPWLASGAQATEEIPNPLIDYDGFLRNAAEVAELRKTHRLTMNVLYSYGYRNVYELGPLIDIGKAKLRFAGTKKLVKPR